MAFVWVRPQGHLHFLIYQNFDMVQVNLNSSIIQSVAYIADHGILEIKFKSRHTYHYYGVPDYVYQELLRAESPGSFFDLYIKKSDYVYEQVE